MLPIDPEKVLRDLGRRVAELRREKKLTQAKLAEALDVSNKYVQRIESGQENLTVASLIRLANLLGVGIVTVFRVPRSRVVRRGRPRNTRKHGAGTDAGR